MTLTRGDGSLAHPSRGALPPSDRAVSVPSVGAQCPAGSSDVPFKGFRVGRTALIVSLAACAAEPPTAPPVVTDPVAVSGNGQAGTPGYLLAQPLTVRVVDGTGLPVVGVTVNWEAGSTDGVVTPGSSVTDRDGLARTRWRLPTSEGTHWAQARVALLPATPFMATSSSSSIDWAGGSDRALCGLTAARTIRCWRPPLVDTVGRSGTVTTPDRFVTMAFSGSEWCAVTPAGRIACFTVDDLFRTGAFNPAALQPRVLTSFGPPLVTLAGAAAGAAPPVYCGVTAPGEAWCWGSNVFGQLGTGTKGGNEELPVRVASSVPMMSIDVGREAVCATEFSGQPYCWGSNATALLGNTTAITERLVPTPVVTPLRFFTLAVTLGGTACGLTSAGQAACWGAATRDALGRPGVAQDDPRPTPVNSQNIFFSLARHGAGFFAVSVDRELVIWGGVPNDLTESGRGYATPTRVTFNERFTGALLGGTTGYSCLRTLAGGARCIDMYVLGPAEFRLATTPARPLQFGVPVQ